MNWDLILASLIIANIVHFQKKKKNHQKQTPRIFPFSRLIKVENRIFCREGERRGA